MGRHHACLALFLAALKGKNVEQSSSRTRPYSVGRATGAAARQFAAPVGTKKLPHALPVLPRLWVLVHRGPLVSATRAPILYY